MIKKGVRLLSLILTFTFTIFFTAGCYDSVEIDDITYVTAIGLDIGKTNPVRMTLQYAVPKNFGSSSSSDSGQSSSSSNKPMEVITIESPTFFAGINMINGFLGKRLDLSHVKLLVFSQKFARKGVIGYINAVTRNRNVRPNVYVAVSRKSAEKYIKSINPVQEIDPIKYYELNFSAYKYTGFSAPTYLNRFYNQIVGGYQSPIATLVSIGKTNKKNEFSLKDSTYKRKKREKPFEGDYYAGDLPKVGDVKSEVFGLAAFNGDKMVTKFDGEECTDYLMVTGQFENANFTVPDPLSKKYKVVIVMKEARNPIIKIKINNGIPYININIRNEGNFLAIQSGINYEMGNKLKLCEKTVNKMFNAEIEQFLKRTQKFNVDICGFGDIARRNFLTWKEWENYKWLDKYKYAKIHVDFKFRIRRTGLRVRTSPIKKAK